MAVRKVSWVAPAKKAFEKFPSSVKEKVINALRIAAKGETADITKPMKGLGAGVYEIAISYRKNAYRSVYAVKIEEDIWVVHAFLKKSKTGIKTPKQEIDLIRYRIKLLKEQLK